MENNKCGHGYRGDCCCNCENQLILHSHPSNTTFGKNDISTTCGYVCVYPTKEGRHAIYSDRQHGICECHYPKTIN